MQNNDDSKKLKFSFIKIISIITLYPLLVAGIYFACVKLGFSSKIALFIVGLFIAGTVVIFIIGFISNKKGRLKDFLKPMIIGFVSVLILANLVLLNSSYFIPHKTTTLNNRYFPALLEMSERLLNYTEDKVLYVDESNDFFDHDLDYYSAVDHSNVASILSRVQSVKILDEAGGDINRKQISYLRKNKDDYILMHNRYERYEKALFYIGIDSENYDKIVFLQDKYNSSYFMPYAIYLEIKDLR